MAMSFALECLLAGIAKGIVDESLTSERDYGTFPYRASLRQGSPDEGDVITFLNTAVRLMTGDKFAVMAADQALFARPIGRALTLAKVPVGKDANDQEAKLFQVGGGATSVCMVERHV